MDVSRIIRSYLKDGLFVDLNKLLIMNNQRIIS